MVNMNLVAVQTSACINCGENSIINVPVEAWDRFSNGESIQSAWPYSTPQEREYLLTGTHPECWEEIFSD